MPVYEIKLVRRKVSDAPNECCISARGAGEYLLKYCYKDEDAWREQVYMLALDSSRQVIGHFLCALGNASSVVLSAIDVARTAILAGARYVILSHNHPSVDPTPGKADIDTTKKIKDALHLVGIDLLDHIVIGNNDCYSFSDERVYKNIRI